MFPSQSEISILSLYLIVVSVLIISHEKYQKISTKLLLKFLSQRVSKGSEREYQVSDFQNLSINARRRGLRTVL